MKFHRPLLWHPTLIHLITCIFPFFFLFGKWNLLKQEEQEPERTRTLKANKNKTENQKRAIITRKPNTKANKQQGGRKYKAGT